MKSIDIKGKKYVQVSERILFFNKKYPNGCIQTELVESVDPDRMIIKATVIPDIAEPNRKFTSYSQASFNDNTLVNKTSALENADTSAVGRALGMMGIGVLEAVASVDEMRKAGVSDYTPEDLSKVLEGKEGTKRTCDKCGAEMKWSETKQKWYCSKLCWKNS